MTHQVTSDFIYVMRDGIINHRKNTKYILKIPTTEIRFKKRVRDQLIEMGLFTFRDVALFVLNNRNNAIGKLIPLNKKLIAQFHRIRVFASLLIKDRSGGRKSDPIVDYSILEIIFTSWGMRNYFSCGGTIPRENRNQKIWVGISLEVIDAIEAELMEQESPLEMALWLTTSISRHINHTMTTTEPFGKKTLSNHLQRLYGYQKEVGGLMHNKGEQEFLDLFWVFDEQNAYHHGDEDARERTFTRMRSIIRRLIFPSKCFTLEFESL